MTLTGGLNSNKLSLRVLNASGLGEQVCNLYVGATYVQNTSTLASRVKEACEAVRLLKNVFEKCCMCT